MCSRLSISLSLPSPNFLPSVPYTDPAPSHLRPLTLCACVRVYTAADDASFVLLSLSFGVPLGDCLALPQHRTSSAGSLFCPHPPTHPLYVCLCVCACSVALSVVPCLPAGLYCYTHNPFSPFFVTMFCLFP